MKGGVIRINRIFTGTNIVLNQGFITEHSVLLNIELIGLEYYQQKIFKHNNI